MTSPSHYSLLVVDDEPDLRTLYELTLAREGYDLETAGSVEEAVAMLAARTYSAVITDMRLPDGTGLDILHAIDAGNRREKVIVITAYGSSENAVQALKAGAYDYLTKPVDLRQFRAVVSGALGRTGATAPVLVAGESGTGKELVARAIHEVSPRSAAPFIAVNCGAIPEQLLEAEFFGYRRGAFTGANEDREGFFQAAHGGTLFLDEIGDLPLSMQSKLLRSIQERAVRPVGAVTEQPVNIRLVSATHKDLAVEVAGGRFRQDLYYRLNVIQIRVPPLRERFEDLADICSRVLERLARDAGVGPPPVISREALLHMARYPFPGNVRELENLLHRAVALSPGDAIGITDLGLPESAFGDSGPHDLDPVRPETTPAELEAALAAPPAFAASEPALPSDLAAHLDTVERDILMRALERHRNNRTAAGASLGLSLRQMRYRMARLGVNVGGDAAERD
jgi:two-component system response regulator PilR (NtrC family)